MFSFEAEFCGSKDLSFKKRLEQSKFINLHPGPYWLAVYQVDIEYRAISDFIQQDDVLH